MKKWLLAVLAIGCIAGGVACSNSGGSASNKPSTELPKVSIEELIEKNTCAQMLEESETLCVTATDKGNKSIILQQSTWYYSRENGELQVDFQDREKGDNTSEFGTYIDGAYYAERSGAMFARIIPEQDFEAYLYGLSDLKIADKTYGDNALIVVDDELVLKTTSIEENGLRYTWSYRFDKETNILTKAQAMVYTMNGIFVKTREITFERDEVMEWEREAYNKVKATEQDELITVTTRYLKDGKEDFSRDVTLIKDEKIYATDLRDGKEYCIYTDAACTQMVVDLEFVKGQSATIYVSEANEEEVNKRDLMLMEKDNGLDNIMSIYGKYYVSCKMYSYKEQRISEQYWYYDDNRAEDDREEDGTATLDYWQKSADGSLTKVVNYRDTAFYTWTSDNRYEFALVVDKNYKDALYTYDRELAGEQNLQTPITKKDNVYTFITTRKENGNGYKTSNWTYTFKRMSSSLLLQDIYIEYCDANGNMLAYAEVLVDYGNEYTGYSDGYDRVAGKRAGTKIDLDIVIDYATKDVRTEEHSLYNKTEISVYASEVGKTYKIFRDELLQVEINTLADFGNAKEKEIYLRSTLSQKS